MKSGENRNKYELYIMSLWLLFVLIIVITIDVPICLGNNCEFIGFREVLRRNIISLVALFLVIIGLVFYKRFEYRTSGSKKISSKIEKIEDVNYEHLTFLTTYIIPLICFNLTSTRYVIALGILLYVIGVIYVQTDKYYANPTLALLGYRLYKVDLVTRTGDKNSIMIITKDRLLISDQIRRLDLDDKTCFARRV